MVDNQFIRPDLNISVEFWGFDWSNPKIGDYSKTKFIQFHPVKSLLLSVDRDSQISIWDYNLKKRVLFLSVNESSRVLDSSSNDQRERSLSVGYQVGRKLSVDHGNRRSNDYMNSFSGSSDNGNTVGGVKVSLNGLKYISFADNSYVQASSCIDRVKIPTTFNTSINSDHFIVATLESSVLFYDYGINVAKYLGFEELTKNPTVAEFVFYGFCLVGCNDGIIRVWDCANWSLAGQLQGHGKSEIAAIQMLPYKKQKEIKKQKKYIERIRFLTAAQDGTALIWEMGFREETPGSFIIEWESENILTPIARLKDNLGFPLTRNNFCFDVENNLLLTSSNEKKIRTWDLEELRAGKKQTGGSTGGGSVGFNTNTGSASKRRGTGVGRRTSLFRQNSSVDLNADMTILNPTSVIKVDKSLPLALSKLASFTHLQHPLFTNGTIAVCSKSSSIAILQDREQQQGEENHSDKSSVVSASNASSAANNNPGEKASRLQLLHEIPMSELMLHYLRRLGCREISQLNPYSSTATAICSNFLDKTLISHNKDSIENSLWHAISENNLKVYSIRAHPSQPHLIALGTSIGSVILIIPLHTSGSLIATHPTWKNTKLLFSEQLIKQVTLDRPLAVGRSLFSDNSIGGIPESGNGEIPESANSDIPESESSDGFGLDAQVEVWEEMSLDGGREGLKSDTASVSSKTSRSAVRKGPSGKRNSQLASVTLTASSVAATAAATVVAAGSTPGGFSVDQTGALSTAIAGSRPFFHPSPDGKYCALVWPDSMLYVVLRVNPVPSELFQTNSNNPTPKKGKESRRSKTEGTSSVDITPTNGDIPTSAFAGKGLEEVERGTCLDLAWVGDGDMFLIKTAPYIQHRPPQPQKRSSILGKVFGGPKGTKALIPGKLVLKRISFVEGKYSVYEEKLVNEIIDPAGVTALYTGNLVGVNQATEIDQSEEINLTLSSHGATQPVTHNESLGISLGEKDNLESMQSLSGDISSEPNAVSDLEKTVKGLRRQGRLYTKDQQFCQFYFLVNSEVWRKYQISVNLKKSIETDKILKEKNKKIIKKKTNTADTSENENKDETLIDGFQLIPLGKPKKPTDTLSWNYKTQTCAILSSNSIIHIMKLSLPDENGLNADLYPDEEVLNECWQVLTSFDFSPKIGLNVSVFGLIWENEFLYVSTRTGLNIMILSGFEKNSRDLEIPIFSGVLKEKLKSTPHENDENFVFLENIKINYSSPWIIEGSKTNNNFSTDLYNSTVPLFNPSPWREIKGLFDGQIFVTNRDNSITCVPINTNPLLSLAVLIQKTLKEEPLQTLEKVKIYLKSIKTQYKQTFDSIATFLLNRNMLDEDILMILSNSTSLLLKERLKIQWIKIKNVLLSSE